VSTITGDVVSDNPGRSMALATWTVVHAPAATVQAVATKAAGAAGVKHVCYGILATVAAGATAQTPLNVVVLDGASPVFSASIATPANSVGVVALMGLNIVGTAATLMTLQFSAGGAATTVQNVTLIGYDVT
jgi:hypothetical protein